MEYQTDFTEFGKFIEKIVSEEKERVSFELRLSLSEVEWIRKKYPGCSIEKTETAEKDAKKSWYNINFGFF